jgi:hypothetical protein
VALVIHIFGDDNPAPEGGVFFKYFKSHADFSSFGSRIVFRISMLLL